MITSTSRRTRSGRAAATCIASIPPVEAPMRSTGDPALRPPRSHPPPSRRRRSRPAERDAPLGTGSSRQGHAHPSRTSPCDAPCPQAPQDRSDSPGRKTSVLGPEPIRRVGSPGPMESSETSFPSRSAEVRPPTGEPRSDVLVDEDRIAVRVDDDEAARAGPGLVDLADELDALLLQSSLELADVGE